MGRLAGLLWFREALEGSIREAADRVAAVRAMWPDGAPCIFAVDEEGGLIQQLSGLRDDSGRAWPRLPSARALGRSDDPGLAFGHGREVGRRMRVIGLDVALAPVVDLDPGPRSAVLATRCFSDDSDRVARTALAWLRGLSSAGVRGCIKHYPGHGATSIDSHAELPRIGADVDRARHRFPFEEISRRWMDEDGPRPGVLTAHVVLGESIAPVTLDPRALSEIPSGLGPIWSDSLDMGALASFGDLEARARKAVAAGVDLLIVGSDVDGGLALARSLDTVPSPREAGWPRGSSSIPVPEEWPAKEMMRAAAAGFRLLAPADLPEGDWDWILPDGFGPYGDVSTPSSQPDPTAPRRISRVLRYEAEDARALHHALESDPSGPALVATIHRGTADAGVSRALHAAGNRVRALAHLLDGPADPPERGRWTCETAGFGELEIETLRRHWLAGRGGSPIR